MLLCGKTCHGVEPVGVVSNALLYSPVLHSGCDNIGNIGIKCSSHSLGLKKSLINVLGKSGLHCFLVKNIAAEIIGYILNSLDNTL